MMPELKNDSVVIVGSRSGGFDYFARDKKQKITTWLGCNENSDIDFYAPKNTQINFEFIQDKRDVSFFKIPNILYGHEFPFKLNEVLYEPKDKTYLCWAIQKRLKLNIKQRYQMIGELFDICEANDNFVTTIPFHPIPFLV